MNQNLFRKEVSEAKSTSWLGSISLVQPIHLSVLTGAGAAAALSIAIFLVFGTYTRRSSVAGQLVPTKGMVAVLAPVTGVVSRMDTTQGSTVAAMQRLAVVTVPQASPVNGDTQIALGKRLEQRQSALVAAQEAQQQMLQDQADGLQVQLRGASRELEQIEAEVATRRNQARIATEILQRLRSLESGQYVSTLQIKQQESTALEYSAQQQGLQRQAIGIIRTIAQLEQALQDLPSQRKASSADFQRDLAQLEQERVQIEAQGASAVMSPTAGVVSTQMVKTGQTVHFGQALMSVLPSGGELEAELLVPSRAIGFIKPGDQVLLRYQAFPYQKFGHQQGRVIRISRSTLTAEQLSPTAGNAQQGESLYRVTASLSRQAITTYGQPTQLKPGMLLEADILGEERRLIEWVFEPLYSLQGKVGSS